MSDHGNMDVRTHQEMWSNFTKLTTWSIVVAVVILSLMATFLL